MFPFKIVQDNDIASFPDALLLLTLVNLRPDAGTCRLQPAAACCLGSTVRRLFDKIKGRSEAKFIR